MYTNHAQTTASISSLAQRRLRLRYLTFSPSLTVYQRHRLVVIEFHYPMSSDFYIVVGLLVPRCKDLGLSIKK